MAVLAGSCQIADEQVAAAAVVAIAGADAAAVEHCTCCWTARAASAMSQPTAQDWALQTSWRRNWESMHCCHAAKRCSCSSLAAETKWQGIF